MPLDTLTALTRYRLLTPEQVAQCPQDREPLDLARELVRRGWLTPYQVDELSFGRGEHLLLGSYVLLDKLGEGGMGTVYKARNWKLDKIVALKVIRKDRLLKPDTIKRFYREIRAVAQLDHPNIVRAFDADEVNDTHFFVMEYVEGTDLHRFVKSRGPLPIDQACDCIRQAALGLQHAFERGLVHRDIKPHNLLLAAGGFPSPLPLSPSDGERGRGEGKPQAAVKILDMGLALVETPTNADDHSGTMTQSGIVMGTPDYMAPEQSRDAHNVDIRADLYSLGCTLYFLLVGRAPFAGGTLTQKLLRHQNDVAESVKKHRPDVPDALEALLFRLLAKRADERYQTPRELASALETIQANLPMTSAQPLASLAVPESGSHTQVEVREGWAEIAPAPAPGKRPTAPLSRLMVPMLAVLAILVLAAGGVWWATRGKQESEPVVKRPSDPPRRKPTDKNELPKPDVELPRGPATDEWVAAVQTLTPDKQAKAVFAKLKELNPGFDDQHENNRWEAPNDKVVTFHFHQPATDISPLRALRDLENLLCTATLNGMGPTAPLSLADLSSLKGLPLKQLHLGSNRVEDLTPLIGMKLNELTLSNTAVRDLTPLKDMTTLHVLHLTNAPIADLSPLRDLKLIALTLTNTAVKDLTPLARMPLQRLSLSGLAISDLTTIPREHLETLDLAGCPVEDLSPLTKAGKLTRLVLSDVPFRSLESLKTMALADILLNYQPRLAELLHGLPSLRRINGLAKDDFWKYAHPDLEQARWLEQMASLPADTLRQAVTERLRVLNPQYTPEPVFKEEKGQLVELHLPEGELADLRFVTPLKALNKLTVKTSGTLRVESLEPLRGLSLRHLAMGYNRVCDLSPLADMPLEHFESDPHTFRDVSPLRGTRLRVALIGMHGGALPLGGFTAWTALPLERLKVHSLQARDLPALSKLKDLRRLSLGYVESSHRDFLRGLTLDEINDKKPDDFWTQQAEKQVEFVRRELMRLNSGFDGKLTTRLGTAL